MQSWRRKCGFGDVLRELHPEEPFVTYRGEGANGPIATWIDHCFASQVLIEQGIISAAGVLDKRRHAGAAEAKVAGSMHNMLAIAVDFGRLLYIGPEVATGELVDMEHRMRYIGGKRARDRYALQMKERLEVLGVEAMIEGATRTRDLLLVARKAVDLRHNMPLDNGGTWVLEADAEHIIHSITGERREWVGDEPACAVPAPQQQQRIDRVHELEADLQAQLDTINGALEEAFREQRATMERRTSGKRKGGWSVTYGKILTNVKDLIAVAAAAVDANPSGDVDGRFPAGLDAATEGGRDGA